MNEENAEKIAPVVPLAPNALHKRWIILVLTGITLVAIIAGGYLLYNKTSILDDVQEVLQASLTPEGIPDDDIFLNGFTPTGKTWPLTEEYWSQERKDNPLAAIRQSYCEHIGYKYADFAASCFAYQYFDSYKIYTNTEDAFTMYYPTFWVADAQPNSYGFVTDAKASWRRNNASCAITYGLIDETALVSSGTASTTKVDYASHASGGFVSERGLTNIYIPFSRAVTNEEKAAGYTEDRIIAVPHFPYADSPNGFLLTSGEKQPLVEACAEEFDYILNTRALQYSAGALTSSSNGVLSIHDMGSWFEAYADIPHTISLVFTDKKTGKEVSIASAALKNVHSIDEPFVSGTKLYFKSGAYENPEIMSIDLVTGESDILPLQHSEGNVIHSFYVRAGNVYYLTGEYCNDYKATCVDMKLHQYNVQTKASLELAGGITSRDIIGLNSTKDKIILAMREGDAGCGWGSYESYSFTTRTIQNLGSYHYCEGDPVDDSLQFKNLISDTSDFQKLILRDGAIVLPAPTDEYDGTVYIRANLDEYPAQVK
ncbi:MAG: hypothetical protein AB203_03145 [Parcubacteria bacterium C7867-008]|nr:MAG: hypothetical protein AB203_03145 [Parcubacteria bacterium C7867-008]